MRSSRSVLAFLIAAGTGFAADVALPDCLPPETKVVFGVSLRSLLDSPVLKSSQSDVQKMSADLMKGGPLSALKTEMTKAGSLPVAEFFKDVDDLIIASTAEDDQSTALIVLHGRFDPNRFPGTSTSYKGVLILGDDGKGRGGVALLDGFTAIAGDLAQLHAAIDRLGNPSGINPALAERVRSMVGRFDFWGVGDLPKDHRPPAVAAEQFSSIDHFEFGGSLRQGLEITAEIHARSPKDAEKMAESMKLIEAMLKAQPSSGDGTKFDLQSSNGTIKLSIAISEEELKKGIEAQKARMAAGWNPGISVTGGPSGAAVPLARTPPTKPAQIVKDDRGDTVKVTLPGGH